jgi:hypothetical protein
MARLLRATPAPILIVRQRLALRRNHDTAKIETTFEEVRARLGLETTRGWCGRTVLRAAPCLFGLYTVVALPYQSLPEGKRSGGVAWPGKAFLTFSDALAAVRRWPWAESVFPQAGAGRAVEKLPAPLRGLLLAALAPAA